LIFDIFSATGTGTGVCEDDFLRVVAGTGTGTNEEFPGKGGTS